MTDIWYARMRARAHTHTHTPKPVYEHEDDTVLWNQAIQTDREVTAYKSDIIIKTKKRKQAYR